MQKTNFTGLVNTVNEVFHSEAQQMYFMKEAYEPYVEFRMFSSVFITENDDVWMVFPRIHNNSVTDLVAAVLSENATQLHYYDIDRSSDFYENNIAAFQKSFSNSELSSTHSSPCGFEDRPPCDIEIVIIQFPNPISYIPPSGVNNIGGGCSPYVMCVYDDNGGGGSGSSPISGLPGQNPCIKTKALLAKPEVAEKIQDLKDHVANGTGEKGWKFMKDGTPPQQTTNNNLHSVNYGDPSLLNGVYHNHTGTTVDIFSASDISTLIEIARYQGVGSIGNAFHGMVAPNGIHYVIRFTGISGADLPAVGSYNNAQLLVWDDAQMKMRDELLSNPNFFMVENGKKLLNTIGLETILMKTLKDMGLKDKVSLLKIGTNNNVSKVIQNPDGSIAPAIPC